MRTSGGTVEYSGFLSNEELFGLVEARADVTALRLIDGEEKIHLMALSFQAETVSEADWLQFLGPSVVAVTDYGNERLVGKITFTKPSGRTVTVQTTLSPSDTPYFLDSEAWNPFANQPQTTLCEKLAGGKEKISFFDQPIGNFAALVDTLIPFLQGFKKELEIRREKTGRIGELPEFLILIAEFYSYLVLKNTAIYLIRWQVEYQVLVSPSEGLVHSDYRQRVLDDECGPVVGLAGEHHAILQQAFPAANIR